MTPEPSQPVRRPRGGVSNDPVVSRRDTTLPLAAAIALGLGALAIQELAGHQDLGTTQRHMHLSPAALEAAIRLLDGADSYGGIVQAPGKLG